MKALLDHGYPQPVLERLRRRNEQELLDIAIGPTSGNLFNAGIWADEFVPFAIELKSANKLIKNMRMWYDAYEDFSHIEFDIAKDHYDIRFYKAYRVFKNHQPLLNESHLFGRESHRLVVFFERNEQDYWHVTLSNETNESIIKSCLIYYQQRAIDLWGREINLPHIWRRDNGFYLGIKQDKEAMWFVGVLFIEDGFQVANNNKRVLATAVQFQTAFHYALQEWPWIG